MTDIVKTDLAYRPWEMAQSSLQEVLGRAQEEWTGRWARGSPEFLPALFARVLY